MYGDTKFNKSIDIITKVHSEKRNEILNGTSDLTKAEVQLFVAEVEKRVEQRLQEIKKN